MGFRKITSQLLTVLLSVILISMLALSFISYTQSENIIKDQIHAKMNSEVEKQTNMIERSLQKITTMAKGLSHSVQSTYTSTSLSQYEEMLSSLVQEDAMVLGSGIWFEPYIYDKNEKYTGPYVHKEGDKAVVTYEYSNAAYDYFSYDWYKNATKGKEALFSELYYDESLGLTIMSCTAPIYSADNTFLGAVTVDMQVSDIQNMINNITIGKKGSVMLLSNDGLYIAGAPEAKILKENIQESENKTLKKIGGEILNNGQGDGSYTEDGVKYLAYYKTVPLVNWHIVAKVSEEEIKSPLNQLGLALIISLIISMAVSAIVIVLQISSITIKIKAANNFTLKLAKGDFTIKPLKEKGRNELSQLINSLNKMLMDNRTVIQEIAVGAEGIKHSGNTLDTVVHKLTEQFHNINTSIRDISEVMMSSSASTEEVSASVEEVHSSINMLTFQTMSGKELAGNIQARATLAEKKSETSYDKAVALIQDNEDKLRSSLEDAKIVHSIGMMAEQIAEIAEQVNLLSLNASIEAARAGAQGKGFAVVATEIGNLAALAAHTVEDIKKTIHQVTAAYTNLIENSNQMLEFMKDTVTADYKDFVDTAREYGKEALAIDDNITAIVQMTEGIDRISSEVAKAITEIAYGSQLAAENSGSILSNAEVVSDVVGEVAELIEKENEISGNLSRVVANFTIND
ncbi:methyl-accepting chemotaxis protein [Anaerocolumna sp. AGMB13020]|uniref:methyl-accepting chemotaxis protein n=1 Tax=Anaerocolumna sp. AGMB13020 TaxID=3081750 RepID=UPI0029535324|nr:methyl-accepting chemotaxis protein [Anaerocolumna sp. AGMB13020]WOO37144.1 methyl-accepting chemotaxis protein [Anaerocolumna sp. AGMB13020]